MNKKKYNLELDLGHVPGDVPGFEERWHWLGLASLTAEGDTLDELYQDATVFTADQDGGEGPYLKLSDLPEPMHGEVEYLLALEMLREQDRNAALEFDNMVDLLQLKVKAGGGIELTGLETSALFRWLSALRETLTAYRDLAESRAPGSPAPKNLANRNRTSEAGSRPKPTAEGGSKNHKPNGGQ